MRARILGCTSGALLLAVLPPLAIADTPQPPSSVFVLQGLDAVWEHRPHRVRVLGVGMEATDAASPAATFWAEVVGGPWSTGEHRSDVADIDVGYAGLSWPEGGAAFAPITGSTTLHLSGHIAIEPERRQVAKAVHTEHMPWPASEQGLHGGAWITGFHVATDADHPHGFTMHALSLALGDVTIASGQASMDVSARVEAAPVPDRSQDLETYGADVVVDWVIVPARPDGLARLTATTDVRDGVALSADADRVLPSVVPVSWHPPADTVQVVGALSGFSVELEEEGAVDGRYLRALTTEIRDARFDPVRDLWDAEVDLRFSNEGQITRQLKAKLSAIVTVLALPTSDVLTWSGRWHPPATRPERMTTTYPALVPPQ